MTKKERVQAVLSGEIPDRLPSQANFTGTMKQKIADHLGIPADEIDSRFDNHLLRLDISGRKRFSPDGSVAYDWWGAGFSLSEEGYLVSEFPLRETTDLDGYPWPGPNEPGLLAEAEAGIKKENRREDPRFILPNFGFALFERAWSLRGLEQFMMDLVLEARWSEELLERISDIQVRLARRWVELGVDGGYFGDDLGAQRGLLFSPDLWRKMFKPRLKKMFSVFTDAGLPVIMHSDGDIWEIIPDLIDIGLNALNPCQPEVLEHSRLKREFGRDLSFYGGLSTQETLPKGTPEEVREAARKCIGDLASDGTGLLFGPSHRMMSDIPMTNIEALLDSLAYCRFDTGE